MRKQSDLAMRVSRNTLIGNLALSAGKLAAGILANSSALISDAVHSISDVFSTVIVMIGIKVSGKASDKNHPYGHERLECVSSIILAIVLLFTGVSIGVSAVEQLREGTFTTMPGVAALVMAIISIVLKEFMFHYTMHAAKILNSTSLKASAWHHRSDAISSVGSFAGILSARLGFPQGDAIASLIICLLIVKVAFDIFKEAIEKVLDTACDDETCAKMREVILSREGVRDVDLLNTRMFGSRIYVDVEISADGSIPLVQAHAIAEDVHDAIEANFQDVKHCMVHVNPAQEKHNTV